MGFEVNDTTYVSGLSASSANVFMHAGDLVPVDYMMYNKPADPDKPYYQPLKDSYEFWSGGKFIPSFRMVLNEMTRRAWIANDFKSKKQWRNK